MSKFIDKNADALSKELVWFAEILKVRQKLHFKEENGYKGIEGIPPPKITADSAYGQLINHYRFNFIERIALMLGLSPYLKPQLLDIFLTKNTSVDGSFTEFGGLRSFNGGFLPTGETLVYLLADDDLGLRFQTQTLLQPDHFFAQHTLLKLDAPQEGYHWLTGRLRVNDDLLDYLTIGSVRSPEFSMNFPAKAIETSLDWKDLILEPGILEEIREIEAWIEHRSTLMKDWSLGKRLRPGYRCLLYGPPGTGKTLTACLLGKATGRKVYRVDLAMVISKYIGETEKNLSKVFERAETKDWILFFDEADALFGKRTEVKDAHDRYANQEVSYLLQRVESYDGIIILASNLHTNLDEAFARRFESIIHLPMPSPSERLLLWKNAFSTETILDEEIQLEEIAEQHEIAGGTIMNVVRYSSLMAIRRGGNRIYLHDILEGLKKEYFKLGKIF